MAGQFHLSGTVDQLVADGSDVGTALDLAALTGTTIKFTSNVPTGTPIPTGGGVLFVPPRSAVVGSDGLIYSILEDGSTSSTAGIDLLADDPALSLPVPLQWQITIGRVTLGGRKVAPKSWWFNASAPGASVTIDQVTPVPGIELNGTSSGGSTLPTQSGHAGTFLKTDGSVPSWSTPAGGGDVSSNTSSSVVGEMALFADTTGKLVKRATGSGYVKLASGVASASGTFAADISGAGAVMTTDTSTASMLFVVDEDNMVSNSATKVPTQQSVKAYVDANIGGVGGGLLITDNGDGTLTFTNSGSGTAVDNGDGTITFS